MSDRFPSISPDGTRIAASGVPSGGQAVQYVGPAIGAWEPVPVEFDAMGGVWQTPSRLLFVRNKPRDPQDGALLLWDGSRVTTVAGPGLEGWSCHNAHLAVWTRGSRVKAVTTSREGHIAGIVDLGGSVILEVDGVEIDRGPISEPRYTGEALVWCKWVDGVRRIFGRKHHGAPTENLSWPFPDDEFWPLIVETPHGLYVLTHGHPEIGRPLWLRPWAEGQTHGHVVATGFTDRPDARARERGLVLVAFSDLRDLRREFVNLAAPLTDVRGPIIVPPIEPPPPPPVEPPKEAPVQLEAAHVKLIERFAAKFPCPGHNEDELREHWTPRLIEQLTYTFPADGWGWKARDRNAPRSSDVIARRIDGRTYGWDIIPGAGTSAWRLDPGRASSMDISDQFFEPRQPVNHLGSAPPVDTPVQPPVTPPVTPSAPPVDLGPVFAELAVLRSEVQALIGQVANVHGEMARADRLDDIIHDSRRQHNEKLDQLLARREPERCRFRFGG